MVKFLQKIPVSKSISGLPSKSNASPLAHVPTSTKFVKTGPAVFRDATYQQTNKILRMKAQPPGGGKTTSSTVVAVVLVLVEVRLLVVQ